MTRIGSDCITALYNTILNVGIISKIYIFKIINFYHTVITHIYFLKQNWIFHCSIDYISAGNQTVLYNCTRIVFIFAGGKSPTFE